jgi:hypothetical protein
MRLSQLRCVACVAPVSVVRDIRNRTIKCVTSPAVLHEPRQKRCLSIPRDKGNTLDALLPVKTWGNLVTAICVPRTWKVSNTADRGHGFSFQALRIRIWDPIQPEY